ncbi:hypothetical protein, partial [Mesorhizobium sp.]|uniref:hypothetical protein n=1 Tax=Mesorhizobium sp. TaxID=1871066 RepID=UPI0025C28E4D
MLFPHQGFARSFQQDTSIEGLHRHLVPRKISARANLEAKAPRFAWRRWHDGSTRYTKGAAMSRRALAQNSRLFRSVAADPD